MIRTYLSVYRALLNNSFSFEAQYRGNTWMKMFVNIVWLVFMFSTIEIIFSQTSSLAGWSRADVYLMTVFWILIDELFMALFHHNLRAISDLITEGNLDLYLTKPISPLFLVSLRIFLVRAFYRFITQLVLLAVVLARFSIAVTLPGIALASVLFVVAIVIEYAVVLIGNTLSFWFFRIDNINDAIGAAKSFGRYPFEIWPKTIRIFFLIVFPLAITSYLPASAWLGRLPWYGALYGLLAAASLLGAAVWFWNFALRRYSSASS